MRQGFVLAVFLALATVAGGAMLAAPGGQGQERPGQIAPAKVWIENGPGEAVPVLLQTPSAVPVQVAGTPTVSLSAATVVQARLARQSWEYRTLDLEKEQDPAAELSRAGADGWEATGIQLLNRSGTPVVMKRPR